VSYAPGDFRFLLACKCGHERRDHIDMFQRCEECSCCKFIGEIPPIPMSYNPYNGYVG